MEVIVSTNEINNYSVSELNYLRESIENMNKFNQIEVLRLLYKNKDIILNENKYGIHVNLSELKKNILDEVSLNAADSNGGIKFLYVAPERLNDEYFLSVIKNVDIALVAIDEAHCISQW